MSEEKKHLFFDEEFDESKFATKSSPVAIILCAFLGFLGAHRFYTGYYLYGTIQLLTCGGFLIWFLIDLIQLFRNKFTDAKGNSLMDYNENNHLASGLCCIATILAIAWGGLCTKQINKFKTNIVQNKNPLKVIEKANNPDFVKEFLNNEDNVGKYNVNTQTGLKISNDHICEDFSGNKKICGNIVNTNAQDAKNIVIKFQLFDDNKKFVAFSEAKIYELKGGSGFDFQAPIFYKTVTNYKMINITYN